MILNSKVRRRVCSISKFNKLVISRSYFFNVVSRCRQRNLISTEQNWTIGDDEKSSDKFNRSSLTSKLKILANKSQDLMQL